MEDASQTLFALASFGCTRSLRLPERSFTERGGIGGNCTRSLQQLNARIDDGYVVEPF